MTNRLCLSMRPLATELPEKSYHLHYIHIIIYISRLEYIIKN